MKNLTKQLGLAAAAGVVVIGLSAGSAWADKQYTCEMTGRWLEQREDFVFQARYVAKNAGADTFTGLYFNATAGTTANVKGAADKGTWLILLEYTDKGHKGQVRELVGTGRGSPDLLTITGNYNYKQDGRQIGVGTSQLIGKCK
jgi:hypothetical protein